MFTKLTEIVFNLEVVQDDDTIFKAVVKGSYHTNKQALANSDKATLDVGIVPVLPKSSEFHISPGILVNKGNSYVQSYHNGKKVKKDYCKRSLPSL